ncbi:hypothetical protein [Ponticoccus alexandrii]|uniref:Uncharacterized protein n=1 Tax=Ponticoccus alexandrii TaxID=1943633 RepID=A0ABX7FFW1_9RHOB|nr:hypothetical protein [Ponticoccus alexandrii]ETA50662.1 hypothetical protein P279_18440 [Rhodobacteraceae bacterium PD-2]QRF68633.1 hypothetical protein GQA70_19800 [Ponticoccus alexandrii]
MKITAIALPEHLHKPVCAAYPELSWTFLPTYKRRSYMGFGPARALIRIQGTFAVWSGDPNLPSLMADLRGAEVLVLHLGAVTPAMSGRTVPEMKLRSFMLLPAKSAPPRGMDTDSALVPETLLPTDLPETNNRNDIAFVPKDCPPRELLANMPKGYILNTTDRKFPLEHAIMLHRQESSILPSNTTLADGLSVASSVIVDDALIAILALQMGKHVRVAGGRFADEPVLRATLEAGGPSAETLLSQHTRYLETVGNIPVPFEDICARVNSFLYPETEADTEGAATGNAPSTTPLDGIEPDATLCFVVGHPPGIAVPPAALFEGSNVIQAPPDFNAAAMLKNPEVFADQDLIVWHRMPSVDWVRGGARAVRLLSRYPAGLPMHLGRNKGFLPVLSCVRLSGRTDTDTDAFTVHFDLARDIAELDESAQRRFRALGHEMLPDLAKLQSVWRIQRHNIFVMNRKLGLQEVPRIAVLGREAPQSELPVQTNPERIEDEALVARLLNEHPDTEIIYQPHPTKSADKSLIARIKGLSQRVKVIEDSYEASELAQVVDAFHTVDSPLGIAALLTQKPVTVYGTPYYAGLGVTHDLDSEGASRPLLLDSPIDLALFVGWHFTENVIFVDPMTGARVPAKDYGATWYPSRMALEDSVAERLLARSELDAGATPEFRNAVLQVLQAHCKADHVRAFLDRLDLDHEITAYPGSTLGFAEAYAGLGDWRYALRIAARVSDHHGAKVIGLVTGALQRIRARLRSTDDRELFGHYLLTLFRRTPAADIEKIARGLMDKRYFGAAMLIFRSIRPSTSILSAICRCQIGRSNLEGARRTIAELVARGMPEAEIETLSLALDEALCNWTQAEETLAQRVRKTPGDLDLILRHAKACEQAGLFDKAHNQFVQLIRTQKSSPAIRSLISLEFSRMNVRSARSLLEAYLASTNPDRMLYSLMGDCLSFDNELEEACEYYFRALQLDALDTPSYTRLCELEAELEEAGRAPEVLWSTRFKEILAQVQDDTVETLLGEGRAKLLENDIDTMRRNATRATELFPNDMRGYTWLGHALAWTPGRRSPEEIQQIIANYRASISAGAEDGWWTSYDSVRSFAFLGQTAEIRKIVKEQHDLLFVGQKTRTGWPRFMAGAALSDLSLAFGGLRDYPRTALFRKHARNFRVATSIHEIRPGEKILFVSEGGVGDEIRYAIPYAELASRFPDAIFSVDERLAPLFRRSFPQVSRFVPIPRFHRTRMNRDLLPQIDQLPDQALAQFFDNNLWALAQEVDVVLPVSSAMADLRPDIASFDVTPRPRLVPDPAQIEAWRKRLRPHSDNLLVGVIGTSRILEYQRIANYFTPEQMGDMYRMPGVTFVSLEYKDDPELTELIRTQYGADYVSFEDLDRMDDFDGVLALSHALDCVVGVNTATIELTGFGGVDTIFAAPNANHIWRDPHGTGEELFFDTMRIVLSRDPSEKHLVTARIVAMLEAQRDAKLNDKKAVS